MLYKSSKTYTKVLGLGLFFFQIRATFIMFKVMSQSNMDVFVMCTRGEQGELEDSGPDVRVN